MVIISSILQQKGIYMFKKSLLSMIFVSALLFQGCSDEEKEEKQVVKANIMVSKNEYVLTATDSKQYVLLKEKEGFSLEGAEDKIVIIDIFATWCPPCKAAASHLSSLQDKYKDDLIILGVTIEDGISNAKLDEFKTQYDARYPLINSSTNRKLINDVAKSLNVGERFPIPLMAIYKDGKLVNHFLGAVEEEFIESDIKKALGK